MSGGGYGVDPDLLKQAAKGINQVIDELQSLGGLHAVGDGAVGRGFEDISLSKLQVGDAGLAAALTTFGERWAWGVRELVQEGNDVADKLDLSAGTYHDMEEYGEGIVKDAVMAQYGAPTVTGEQASKMSWGEIGDGIQETVRPDASPDALHSATDDMRRQWSSAMKDSATSGVRGASIDLLESAYGAGRGGDG
ncbi:hypothetical protein ACYSUO_05210 [Streptomyces sp. UC4497]